MSGFIFIAGMVFGASVSIVVYITSKPKPTDEKRTLKCEYCGAASEVK